MNLSNWASTIGVWLSSLTYWEVTAFFGCAAVETCYVPQLARLYKMKDAQEISLFFPSLNVIGRTITVVCLTHVGQNIFAFWIMIGLLLRFMFLAQVVYYRWRRRMLDRLREETMSI